MMRIFMIKVGNLPSGVFREYSEVFRGICSFQPRTSVLGGICGVGTYLVRRNTEDIPWLIGGLGMLFNGLYTKKVIYPNSIAPLMDPNLLKDNGERCVSRWYYVKDNIWHLHSLSTDRLF